MKLALFGYGGHAREVAAQMNEEITFFVDDKYMLPIIPISRCKSILSSKTDTTCVL